MPGRNKKPPDSVRRGYGDGGLGGTGRTVRFGEADPELLRECIDAITNAGDAVVLTLTADHGAYCVRVLSDAGNGVWYPPTPEALTVTLSNAADIARGL